MVKPRENRVPMMLSNDELEAIDEWRFANRVATRSEAIRRLCQMALILDKKLTPLTKALNEYGAENGELLSCFSDLLNPNTDEGDATARFQIHSRAAITKWQQLQYMVRDLTGRAYDFKHEAPFEEVTADAEKNRIFFEEVLGSLEEISKQYQEMKARYPKPIKGIEDKND